MLPVWAIGIIVAIVGFVCFVIAITAAEKVARGRHDRLMRYASSRDRRNYDLALLIAVIMLVVMFAGAVLLIADLFRRFVWPLIMSVADFIPWSASGSGEEAAWLFAAFGLGAIAFGFGGAYIARTRS